MFSQELTAIQDRLANFSPRSKVWIYYSGKPFAPNEHVIQEQITFFTQDWTSHGSKVTADGFVLSNHIIMLVADTSLGEVSGCSTDSSVRFMTNLGKEYELDFFDRNLVLVLINDSIQVTNIHNLKNYPADALVFNPFFSDLQEWRSHFTQSLTASKYKRLV
jgi:hypothetical protein